MCRVLDAYNAGNMDRLAEVVNEAVAMFAASRGEVLGGVVSAALGVVRAGQASGLVRVSGADVLLDPARYSEKLNHYMFLGDSTGLNAHLQLLFDAVAGVRRAMPIGSRMSLSDSADDAQDQPVPVRIVGMPERQTTTSIERDSHDRIIRSVQTEKDIEQHEAGE